MSGGHLCEYNEQKRCPSRQASNACSRRMGTCRLASPVILQKSFPPSDEGGGKTASFDVGRDNNSVTKYFFSPSVIFSK